MGNLTLACQNCNEQNLEHFVKNKIKLQRLIEQLKTPLKDAAAVNATRKAIGNALKKAVDLAAEQSLIVANSDIRRLTGLMPPALNKAELRLL